MHRSVLLDEVVQWLFETYASTDVGFRWLARELNAKGVATARGGKWAATQVSAILDRAALAA